MGEETGTIVWQRSYDAASHQRRMHRFWKYFVAPSAALIVLVAILVGVGEASGVLILLGLFGSMLFVWIWLDGRNERTNTTITQIGRNLHWGRRSVPIDQVTRFSTYVTSGSMAMANPATGTTMNAGVDLGAARFVLVDGTEVQFV